jgi:hypothetical protein
MFKDEDSVKVSRKGVIPTEYLFFIPNKTRNISELVLNIMMSGTNDYQIVSIPECGDLHFVYSGTVDVENLYLCVKSKRNSMLSVKDYSKAQEPAWPKRIEDESGLIRILFEKGDVLSNSQNNTNYVMVRTPWQDIEQYEMRELTNRQYFMKMDIHEAQSSLKFVKHVNLGHRVDKKAILGHEDLQRYFA